MEEGLLPSPHPFPAPSLSSSGPPPPYLLRCSPPAAPPAIHTRALQKPGPHKRYLHSQASLPSTRDVYLNFKWRGLLRALEAPGSQGPLTTRSLGPLSLSEAHCPEDNNRSRAARRGPWRRGGDVPVFFAFQSPGSCFLQIEIARKNLPAGITEGF